MSNKIYEQVSKERYEIILGRYNKYLDALSDPEKEPVRVFDPLPKKMLDELEMIREVSRELQAKKEDDMRKAAAQAASQAEEEAKKAAEGEKEGEKEGGEKTEETEKKE